MNIYKILIMPLFIGFLNLNATNLNIINGSSTPVNVYIKGQDIFGNYTLDKSFSMFQKFTWPDLIDIGYTNSADIWLKTGSPEQLIKSVKITRDKNGFYTITDQQTGAMLCNSGNNAAPGKLTFNINGGGFDMKGNPILTVSCNYTLG